MAVITSDARQQQFYAGVYLRTKTRTRFWGWGKKKIEHATTAEMEQPWTTLADWLRLAHSLLDSKAMDPPLQSNPPDNSVKSD